MIWIQRATSFLAIATLVAACGRTREPLPPQPTSADVESPGRRGAAADRQPAAPAGPAADAPPAGPALGALGHLWTAETKDWNGALLLTDDRDLLAFASRTARVHARDDGRVLHTATTCGPVSKDAVAWVDPSRFLVVCGDELRAYSYPKLGSERVVAFAQRVDQGAFGGAVVAVAEDGFHAKDRKGLVRVLAVDDGRTLDELAPPAEVQALAVSPDGAQVVIATDDEVLVRDVRARTTRSLRKARLAKGFAFSPDGRALFGRFDSFTARVVDVATGAPRGASWEVGSWLTAARWLDDATVAATGSDGLALFRPGGKVASSPVDDLGEGLAVARDGATVCAGGRGGRIACFARARPGPSPAASLFPAGGASPSDGAAPPAATSADVEGRLVSRAGARILVDVDPAVTIEPGSTGALSRRFEQNIGFVISGWITIAEVKVTSAVPGRVTLQIVSEKSAMTMNGRPVNHFTPGEVRLGLSPPP